MCGLVGLVTSSEPRLPALLAARERIAHRGPDDAGVEWFRHGEVHVGLASRRLAILDLSPSGHMPMANADGRIWIVFNGEIYNFRELRAELEAAGRRFHSTGDTEVVLQGYEAHGLDFIARLNGMFALAIWDARSGELVLARDRLGIKPLYVHRRGHDLFFGSEIKALLALPGVPRAPDLPGILGALTFLGVPGTGTGFEGIEKLAPGHTVVWRDGQVATRPFWELTFPADRGDADPARLAEELRALLGRVVGRQMISDRPVGAFLSGGLDSSVLVALMARHSDHPVDAYTITYRAADQRWERMGSEAQYARLVAQSVGANHREILLEPDIAELLPRIAYHLDEPVGDPAAISTYLICAAAREHSTVLLAGQGADELFAGYHFYTAERMAEVYGRLPSPLGRPLASLGQALLLWASRMAPATMAGRLLAARRFGRQITVHAYDAPAARHAALRAYFDRDALLRLVGPDLRETALRDEAGLFYRTLYEQAPARSPLNRQIAVDMRTHLPDLILNYSDKLSMAASVELRVPFLDNEVVDFAGRLAAGQKLRGLEGKATLRDAVRPLLPPPILSRRKMPFGVPIRGWLRRDLAPMVDDLLSDAVVQRRGYFDPPAVRAVIRDSRESVGTSAHQVWALLMLELWHREFIDTASAS
jgi:asparagine synthase (glutamine-hydrolysing)